MLSVKFSPSSLTVLTSSLLWSVALSSPTGPSFSLLRQRNSNSLDNNHNNWAPESHLSAQSRSLHGTSPYLPAQIGAIVGAYGVSLVLVAITLLALAKKRREHLQASDEDFVDEDFVIGDQVGILSPKHDQFEEQFTFVQHADRPRYPQLEIPESYSNSGIFSSQPKPDEHGPTPYVYHSPSSSRTSAPLGIEPLVDQSVVAADRAMAQQQLEDMYKHVMEHEDAKERGVVLESPVVAPAAQAASATSQQSTGLLSKKGRNKPSSLNLSASKDGKSQSRTSSILSAILSPKRKTSKVMSISSPIMTPMSGTFPPSEAREMNPIPQRNYAPAAPPPIPTDQSPFGAVNTRVAGAPLTPDTSPESIQTIDERIGTSFDRINMSRSTLQAPTERDPESATSEHSQAPLIGLPTSPKPGSRFPSLPSSPKPGATFSRTNIPSAVRTNGTLPLRAYEEQLGSPSVVGQTTKQTVFERKGPMSPGTGRTPFTGAPVPYSPYQPKTPCIPITPSLVTKEDRKRMRRMVPKTPTVEMVRSDDEIW